MNELPHLRLEGTAKPEQYTSPNAGGGVFKRPARNQPVHAKKVRRDLEQANDEVRRRRAEDAEANPNLVEWQPEGVVLTFRSDPDHELNLERLERDGAGIQLLGVTVDAGVQTARAFVPEGRLTEFLKLVDAYAAIGARGSQHDRREYVALSSRSIRTFSPPPPPSLLGGAHDSALRRASKDGPLAPTDLASVERMILHGEPQKTALPPPPTLRRRSA